MPTLESLDRCRARFTPRSAIVRARILDAIRAHPWPPTLAELGEALGGMPVSTVHGHVQALREAGLVAGSGRQLRVVPDVEEVAA